MGKPLALILTLLGLACASFLVAGEPLQAPEVGLIEFSPLVTYDDALPTGPLFAYGEQILKAAGILPRYQEVSINRGLEQLRSQQLDMVLTLFRSGDRSSFVRYSKDPLLEVEQGFCTTQDLQSKPLRKSTRLVHVRGTIIPPGLDQLQLVPVNGERAQVRMLQMLQRDRVDAIYSPKPEVIVLAALAAKSPGLHCYRLKGTQVPIHFGFSFRVPEAVIQKLDQALHRARQTENFDVYLHKQLKQAGIAQPDIHSIDALDIKDLDQAK